MTLSLTLLILATIALTFSLNNVILLLNFLSILFPLGFELFRYSIIESTLLILIIYSSALVLLFLVNGLLVLSSFRQRDVIDTPFFIIYVLFNLRAGLSLVQIHGIC